MLTSGPDFRYKADVGLILHHLVDAPAMKEYQNMPIFKFIVVLSFICGVSACAVTAISKDHKAVFQSGQTSEEVSKILEINCRPTIYSAMISFLIPLPPLVPLYGITGDGKVWISFDAKRAANAKIRRVTLRNREDKVIFEDSLTYIYDHVESMKPRLRCWDLQDFSLQIWDGDGKIEDAKLSYIEGKIEFDWGYLAQ